ncbi:DoxX family protein [Patescibacteria group bacterium]|nr:MAG: DoxX family protein [Patescibacteria group bacterium]
MLNPFPNLLAYGLLAPLILRLVLGLIFLNLGYLKLRGERERWQKGFEVLRLRPARELVKLLAIIEIVGGAALIAGFYTQIAALVFAVITALELFIEYREETLLKRDFVFYFLVFAISLSLLFSGAGFFAFDLPL